MRLIVLIGVSCWPNRFNCRMTKPFISIARHFNDPMSHNLATLVIPRNWQTFGNFDVKLSVWNKFDEIWTDSIINSCSRDAETIEFPAKWGWNRIDQIVIQLLCLQNVIADLTDFRVQNISKLLDKRRLGREISHSR